MRGLLEHRHRILLHLCGFLHLVGPTGNFKFDPFQQHPTLHLRPPLHDGRIPRLQQQDGDRGETDPQGTRSHHREKEHQAILGRG